MTQLEFQNGLSLTMQNNFQNDNAGHSSPNKRPAVDHVVPLAENDEELMDDLFDAHAKLAEQGHIAQP